MKIVSILMAAAALTVSVQTASAAVIGSLDISRVNVFTTTGGEVREGAILGNNYSALRDHMISTGSTLAAGATTVTADYLAGVDLFITGTPTLNANTLGQASASEQAALRDWVSGGGIAFLLGEAPTAQTTANTWMEIFGLSISGDYGRGTGRWAPSDNPLLDAVTGGLAALALDMGGSFAADGPFDDVLARYGLSGVTGEIAIVGLQYGDGYVIAAGDSSTFTDQRFRAFNNDGLTPSRPANFISNIIGMADARVTAVPVPASLPLLLAGLAGLGLLRQRSARAA